jgi:hypothetical protein
MTVATATPGSGSRGPALRWGLGLGAIVFGAMTLLSGGKVLFGGAAARADAGAVVDFVLLFNFGAGFVYVLAGVGALARQRWSLHLARLLAGATLLVFAALGVHIAMGGAFETRTVAAMTLRSAFWLGQALALAHILKSAAGVLPNPERRQRP